MEKDQKERRRERVKERSGRREKQEENRKRKEEERKRKKNKRVRKKRKVQLRAAAQSGRQLPVPPPGQGPNSKFFKYIGLFVHTSTPPNAHTPTNRPRRPKQPLAPQRAV